MLKTKLIIGTDKFPLIKLSENTFIHLLPITKFQFERFVWSTKSQEINYKNILETDQRISPLNIIKKNFENIFISNITFTEAEKYVNWMGGRLPIKDEILKLHQITNNLSLELILSYIDNRKTELDKRVLDLLQSLNKIGINSIYNLFTLLKSGELCLEYKTIKNEIFLFHHKDNAFYKLVGAEPENLRSKKIFRTVIENGET